MVVRIRPLSSKELQDGRQAAAKCDKGRAEVVLEDPRAEKDVKRFTFDTVYGSDALQSDIYAITAAPIVGKSPILVAMGVAAALLVWAGWWCLWSDKRGVRALIASHSSSRN